LQRKVALDTSPHHRCAAPVDAHGQPGGRADLAAGRRFASRRE